MTAPQTEPAAPGDRFNIAAHLMAANAGRPDKAAFVDDQGSLSYRELELQVRRLAAGLRAMLGGARRKAPERSVAFAVAVIALAAKMAKADGRVTQALARHGIEGASVAPAEPA